VQGAELPQQGPQRESRVLNLLAETRGNKPETARRLGVSRTTLFRWLKQMDQAS
jgi:transcriptional regulator of acetoin/glycerol metabolism